MTSRVSLLALVCAAGAMADTGVLIPGDRQQPDPAVFSLNEMALEIRIDNGIARIRVRQIFGNHTSTVKEGVYQFALPGKATVSDFAVWDDVTRIPGVILERRRAGEIYQQAKAQAIDPGLLQMGERDADEARRSQQFTARIVPIPSFGTKRIEMEYQHPVAVERYRSEFVVPLKPDVYGVQIAGRFTVDVRVALRARHPGLRGDCRKLPAAHSGAHAEPGARGVLGSQRGVEGRLHRPLCAGGRSEADTLRVITERESATGPGFFQAQALLRIPRQAANRAPAQPPRTFILLFDNSLSMQWDKLERSFAACEAALRRLRPTDSFNLLLFNSEVEPAIAAAASSRRRPTSSRRWRSSATAGFAEARTCSARSTAALAQIAPGEPYFLLISDGGATEGTIHNGKLAAWYTAEWSKRPAGQRPHTLVLRRRRRCQRAAAAACWRRTTATSSWVRSTEPIDFKLNAFLDKIGAEPVQNLSLAVTPAANVDLVYPLEDSRFAGSMATWAGQYKSPLQQAAFTVQGTARRTTAATSRLPPACPHCGADHPELPRTWAKARVDALLREDRAGGRGPRGDRRNHPALEEIQIRHALHVVPRRSAGAAASARDSSGRPRPAREGR